MQLEPDLILYSETFVLLRLLLIALVAEVTSGHVYAVVEATHI